MIRKILVVCYLLVVAVKYSSELPFEIIKKNNGSHNCLITLLNYYYYYYY